MTLNLDSEDLTRKKTFADSIVKAAEVTEKWKK